ncbi:MAG: hypothetical protein M3O36_03835 [Myxococcota bacterium]|nr:hypothetical protein [Myxococcota bacterium]
MPPTAVSQGPSRSPRRYGLWTTLLCLAVMTAALAWRGFGYYRLGLAARATHPDYHLLNPAGLLGHGYGMVGTALIVTNLFYLVRRRYTQHIPASFGSVKAWFNAHVFTGLIGSLLILFHSAFQLRTPIATVTSVSLGVVVLTGLVGLYLYHLLPKAGLHPLRGRLAELQPLMPGLVRCVEEFVKSTPVTQLRLDASFVRAVATVPRWVLQARARRRGIERAVRGDQLFRLLVVEDAGLAGDLVSDLRRLCAAEVDTQAGSAVMRSWRSLHRFLAILMVVSVSVHIAVAWYFGFRWIFG